MSTNLPIPAEFKEIATICSASEGMIGGRTCLIVDGRALHKGLNVGRAFRAWMSGRVDEFGFVSGQDFEIYDGLSRPNLDTSKSRTQKTKEYRLTLDMAKELSMVENNDRGRLARRYFIWREQQAMEVLPPVMIAEIEKRMMGALGGMVKGIMIKQVGSRLDKMEERIDTALTSYDPSAGFTTEYRPMLDFIVKLGVPPKARRSLVSAASRRCSSWLIRQNRHSMLRPSRETGRNLFHVSAVPEWMKAEGAQMVRDHMDRLIGQSMMPLQQPKKASRANFRKTPERPS